MRVERLAKQLGVAKSGFYWHLKNRHALLMELLRYWEEEYTGVVIAEARLKELSPRDRLLEIASAQTQTDDSPGAHTTH